MFGLGVAKLYIGLGVLVAMAALGGLVFQRGVRIEQLQVDKDRCIGAQAMNAVTIAALTEERDRTSATCGARLTAKDNVIKGLRMVIAAGGNNGRTTQPTTTEPVRYVPIDDGSIVNLLDGMLPGQSSNSDGIHTGETSSAAARAALPSGVVVYCLDEVNAKRLATNVIQLRGWALDLYEILKGYQEEKPAEESK